MNEIPEVYQLISERIKQKSLPDNRNDPYKVGLVIEGGAMRGVISAGMTVGLEALDSFLAFDSTYSVSAGSCAAMYFAAGQTPEGTSIYYQDINNENFIDLKRPFFQRKPIVDIPFLTHEIMRNQKTLEWEKIIASPVPLHVYATEADSAEVIEFTNFKDRDFIHDVLHITCRMPIFAGYPYFLKNGFYTDGAVLTGGIPLQFAIEDDCSHILVLSSKPEGTLCKKITNFDRLTSFLLKKNFPLLSKKYWEGFKNFSQAMEIIQSAKLQSHPGGPRVKVEAVQLPRNKKEISRLEKDKEILIQATIDGYNTTLAKFVSLNLSINEQIKIKY